MLLRSQVKERKFFNSGDFAISKVTKNTVTGNPQTGKQHPMSSKVPQLSAPVPCDSNVESDANASVTMQINGDLRGSIHLESQQQSSRGKLESSKGFQLRVQSRERFDSIALSWLNERVLRIAVLHDCRYPTV
ncbi:hypothetical protein CLAIMM_15019 [Cladophialophora immunda]|nr:hypothetical protein CLAIMM_15019 [Cladophialophora immunda]